MKKISVVCISVFALAIFFASGIAFADMIDKAAGAGGAALTHKKLKKQAKEKKKNGEQLTFAEKHPVITAVGVGAAANQFSHDARDKK